MRTEEARKAYSGYDGNDYEIYTINSGGGGKVKLTDNTTDDYDPSYSPSGKKIAYRATTETTTRSTPSTLAGEVRSNSPTTPRTTTSLPTRPTARR